MPDSGKEREIIDGLVEDAAAAEGRGAIDKAKALYGGILRLQPDHTTALRRLGDMEMNDGDPQVALNLFQRATATGAVDAGLCYGIATALRLMGDRKGFHLALRAALRINANYPPALYDLAVLHQQNKNYAAAQKVYQRLVVTGSQDANIFFNSGVVAFRRGDLIAAERWFHASAMVDPKAARAFINLGMVYRTWGYLKEARACVEQAVALVPDNAYAHWNLANVLLVSGVFEQGFAEYEWRFRRPGREDRPRSIPRWTGAPLDGRTILLTLEQGIGDAFQFIRFAEQVKARGGRVVAESHPGIEALLATAPGVDAVVTGGTPVPDAQFYLPLMSLPFVLGTRVDTIPAAAAYLTVPAGTPRATLAGEGLRVGLVWRGNPNHEADALRSVSLDTLAPLLKVPNVSWFSLQVGAGASERESSAWAARMPDLDLGRQGFAATAAAIAALDLVVTVDTSVAHLAGALGKPVWVLIQEANDWRWLHGRSDTPWYPSMRLYRQHRGGNWRLTVFNLLNDLKALAAG